jgi:Protein of unknown function (DUF2934)
MDEETKKKHVVKRSVQRKKDSSNVSAETRATKKKAKRQPKKLTVSKKTEHSSGQLKPTSEQIRLRAYFISEQRRSAGFAGDEHGDWLRAERELQSELLAEKISAKK